MTQIRRIPNADTISVGRPITRLGISFFPLYLHGHDLPPITSGAKAGLQINELQRATVQSLVVHNPMKTPILIVEGEQLDGGKQNRIVNASVLVGPDSTVEIPVSCVEAGRWGQDREYKHADAFSAPRIRHQTQASVTEAVSNQGGRLSDQGLVWAAVDDTLNDLRLRSATQDALEAGRIYEQDYERHKARKDLTDKGPLRRQCGLAISHGYWVTEIQLFGSPHLLATHWKAIIGSQLLAQPRDYGSPSSSRVLRVLARFATSPVKAVDGIGMGRELRVMDEEGFGQALTLDGTIVHASYYTRREEMQSSSPRPGPTP